MSERVPLKFQIGQRTIATAHRKLFHRAPPLAEVLSGVVPDLAPLPADMDGYRLRSVPLAQVATLEHRFPGWIVRQQQRYARHFIRMEGQDFDTYLSGFSGKTRSTMKRKLRKFADECGGTLDVRAYRTADEMDAFMALARPLSALTYQERLLDAGLPSGPDALARMREQAERDDLRAFLLFKDGRAVSYLYLPVRDDSLLYAFLGYDPDVAALSAGTVLQLEALRLLFAENRFAYFDFCEGEGPHKALFGTDSVDAADMLILRPTAANRALLWSMGAFDGTVAGISDLAERTGMKSKLRKLLRAA